MFFLFIGFIYLARLFLPAYLPLPVSPHDPIGAFYPRRRPPDYVLARGGICRGRPMPISPVRVAQLCIAAHPGERPTYFYSYFLGKVFLSRRLFFPTFNTYLLISFPLVPFFPISVVFIPLNGGVSNIVALSQRLLIKA